MNATSPSPARHAPVSGLDTCCRAPLFVFFTGAAVWLVVASAFSLIASIKFHAPNFLADCAWLTYGRVRPAANNALLYGFAVPAGLGAALWIFARAGAARAVPSWLITLGAKVWHLGVLAGLVGILAGDSTGFENLEMPRYAAVLLFIGYSIAGIGLAITLHQRQEPALQPSQWFLLAALFWFPWIFSTAHLLLTVCPVRGVMQAVVAWWFSNHLTFVWLGLVGLGVIFHFVSEFTGRPLHSRYLALFVFWTLILFGSWCGIPVNAPVPAWMPVISSVAAVLTIPTLIAIGLNVYRTKRSATTEQPTGGVAPYVFFGLGMFQLAGLMRAAAGVPEIGSVIHFTWFTVAQWQLTVYGFFAMTMFGAIYHIVPQVTGVDWPRRSWVRAHFSLAGAGTLLLALPLTVGGVLQGLYLNDPKASFAYVTQATLLAFRASTLGELFLLAGHLLLLANLALLSIRYYRTNFLPLYRASTEELKPAKVRS